MTTHEREITEPIALAINSGRRLNRAARGWSRHLLQTANQRGHWGRKKRWDYWSIQAGELLLSGVVANLDFMGTADVWWRDLSTNATGGRGCSAIGGRRFVLPDVAGSEPIEVESVNFRCAIHDDEKGNTSIEASWTEPSGAPGKLSVIEITTCFWFDGNAREAAEFYTSIFPDSALERNWVAQSETPSNEIGEEVTVSFQIFGRPFLGINGGPDPEGAARATEAMLQMRKIDLAVLEAAYFSAG